jgi:hypothetical protein
MLCLAVTVSVEQSLALAAELENTVFSPSQQGLTTAEPQTGSLGTLKKAAVRAIALGFGPAANRLLLYPASPFSRRSSRQVRILIGMAELNVAFQSSFPALNGRPGADYDALERGPAPNAIALRLQ